MNKTRPGGNNQSNPGTTHRIGLLAVLYFVLSPLAAMAGEKSYSPAAERDYPTHVYWGDTHLHTKYSLDAYATGNTKISPHEAYRLARGETVTAHNGMRVKLREPLDFLAITDHGEYLAVPSRIELVDPILLGTETGKRWNQMRQTGGAEYVKMFNEMVQALTTNTDLIKSTAFEQSVWDEVGANAELYNDPGKFTTFIAYEWSTTTLEGNNLHRNVIFRDGPAKTSQVLPFSSLNSDDPAKLWDYLAGYERNTGGAVLAIPHNGNLSNGLMFAPTDFKGNPFSSDYVATRARWEPLYEVTQYKGDSEAHPFLSPTDEFADYERWDKTNILMRRPHKNEMTQYEYARPALKLGLQLEQELGANPFKFGLVGGTDSHTGFSTADENNYWGKLSQQEPSPDRWSPIFLEHLAERTETVYNWQVAASGYTAVWAQENTRESLFSALKRKEVYASTGPRIELRFFAGWSYATDDALSPDLAAIGYRKGVPMGGDLSKAPTGKAPSFLIQAKRDPDGANLDRLQVIKGWLDDQGKLQEKIHDVALADGRTVDTTGKAPPVGNTVDVASASYSNSIGDPELAVVWKDPDFSPDLKAFYYLRVIEIPTPRWTAYDAKFFGITMGKEVPMVTQERAYSSPIWYTP